MWKRGQKKEYWRLRTNLERDIDFYENKILKIKNHVKKLKAELETLKDEKK